MSTPKPGSKRIPPACDIKEFLEDSLELEGTTRPLEYEELESVRVFLRETEPLTVARVTALAQNIKGPAILLRDTVSVNHPRGNVNGATQSGPEVFARFEEYIRWATSGVPAAEVYVRVYHLEPYDRYNGYIARLIYLWQYVKQVDNERLIPFLEAFHAEALELI